MTMQPAASLGHAAPVLFALLPAPDGRAIGVATLNVEKSLNALSMEMVDLLAKQLRKWEHDPSIAMVLLQGAGEKALCAGGDLQQLYASMQAHHLSDRRADVLGNSYALHFFDQEYRLDHHIHTYRKPILCWGHGIVMGGGIGLMAGASHRVVTERSRLAMPEAAIGLFPDVGGSWFLNRMPGKLGLFLALTGAAINAADALFVKLADHYLPHAAKPALLASLQAQQWRADDALNHALLSQLLLDAGQAVAPPPPGPLRLHFDLINELCAGPDLPRIVARIGALDGSDPACATVGDNPSAASAAQWLQKAASAIRNACPGSLWLAHALQQRCVHLSLAEVFRLELGVALACGAGPDFAEGIRALLIDKDLRPRWRDASVAAADRERFFDSPWPASAHPLRELGTAG